MKLLRLALSIVAILLLCGGYGASQYAYFQGRAPQYATQIDQPRIQYLSLFLLVASVALAFVRERNEEPGEH